ncbi:MAG: hypothetical protein WC178_03390 [Candidatus Paceibacterota bacterium]
MAVNNMDNCNEAIPRQARNDTQKSHRINFNDILHIMILCKGRKAMSKKKSNKTKIETCPRCRDKKEEMNSDGAKVPCSLCQKNRYGSCVY